MEKVPLVCFPGVNEARNLGSSAIVVQYTALMSTDELGANPFKSRASPNASITALAGFGKSRLVRSVLVPIMVAKYGYQPQQREPNTEIEPRQEVWMTSSTEEADLTL